LAVVTDKFDNGDVEPVCNLCVANAHTYFVGNEHCAVLVHNTSPFTALISTALFGQVSVRPAPTLRPMPRPGGFQGPRGNPSNPGPRNDRGFSNPGPNPGPKEPLEIPQWQRGDLDYLPSDGGANDTVNARIREANQRERDKFNDQRTQAAVESARAQGVPENVIQATIKQQHLIAPGQTPPDNIAALNKITAQYWAEANPNEDQALRDMISSVVDNPNPPQLQPQGDRSLGGNNFGGYGIGGRIATGGENPLHGNSLATDKVAQGYTLRDKTTGEIVKYGETTMGAARYSKTWLQNNNLRMQVETTGTKAEMHQWQHEQILTYKANNGGQRPRLNKSDY
jgi:hypothetical protein